MLEQLINNSIFSYAHHCLFNALNALLTMFPAQNLSRKSSKAIVSMDYWTDHCKLIEKAHEITKEHLFFFSVGTFEFFCFARKIGKIIALKMRKKRVTSQVLKLPVASNIYSYLLSILVQ